MFVSEWHCRQSVLMLLTFSRRDIWRAVRREWHVVQPSVLITGCSKTNGPPVSVWHFVHTAFWSAVDLTILPWNVPWGSWQSLHFINPSSTLWWKGCANAGFTSVWQV